MKTKLLVLTFVLAVIVSFSFISIDKKNNNNTEDKEINTSIKAEPMSGFALEDVNQF